MRENPLLLTDASRARGIRSRSGGTPPAFPCAIRAIRAVRDLPRAVPVFP